MKVPGKRNQKQHPNPPSEELKFQEIQDWNQHPCQTFTNLKAQRTLLFPKNLLLHLKAQGTPSIPSEHSHAALKAQGNQFPSEPLHAPTKAGIQSPNEPSRELLKAGNQSPNEPSIELLKAGKQYPSEPSRALWKAQGKLCPSEPSRTLLKAQANQFRNDSSNQLIVGLCFLPPP